MPQLQPIPQPKTSPLMGNLKNVDGSAPIQGFMRLAKALGPIYTLDLFGRRLIFLSSQELVNEVCDETRFDKRVHGALKQIRDFAGDGLFTAYTKEDNWGKAHRLLMPAFGPIGIRGMFDPMMDIAEQLFTRWERFGDRARIDVADNMTRLTLDTIALCAFDYRFNSFYQNEMHPLVGSIVDALVESGARSSRPEIATKLMVSTRRKYEADIKLMHQVCDTLIAERRADPERGKKKDLLALMLQGRDSATGEGLSDENVRYQIITFLIAGHETTSGLLTFAIYLLLKNPRVLNKLRADVDAILGQDVPRIEHLAKLRYTEQVLMESLRLWPTASLFGLRPNQDTVIGGKYAVTPQDTLMVLLPNLHRDPKVWGDDAEEFKPERFEADAAAKLPPNAWKPFGNGQRACIGRAFAMQEAQLVLSMLVQRFDIVADDPAYQLQIAETLTIKPAGFFIRAKSRGLPAFRARSALDAAPQRALKSAPDAAASGADSGGTPLLVLYGSNSGSSEAFAQRLAGDAPSQGYSPRLATLDECAGQLPTQGAVVVITASYEGGPTDNARQFFEWLAAAPPASLHGVSYAVFGCGNRQWARTYQAIPQRIDTLMETAGAKRIKARGEADASGDFFGGFDEWYATLWNDLGQAFGKARQEGPSGPKLEVETVAEGRSAILRQTDLGYGQIVDNRELVDMRSPLGRSKRHFEIALPEGMSYRTGDYLVVLPRNPAANVDRALRRFGFAHDSQVILRKSGGGITSLPTDYPVSVSELLSSYVELSQPATRAQVGALAEATRCPPDKAALATLAGEADYAAQVLGKRLSVLDLLERFAACELDFAAFLGMLPPMRSRQYSISSSSVWNDSRVTLTVAVVDAPALSGQGRYLGIASSYLADARPGARVSVAVRPSNTHFHPPVSPETPMVMVCAGSGLAPFRGFIQERAVQAQSGQKVGKALLFYGCDHPDVDFLYRDELAEWEAAGAVSVRPAFSEAPQGDVKFVQHRVWQDRDEVAELFAQGATIYVCGDGRYMAPAVREAFLKIYSHATGATPEAAAEWADKVERETGRYVADVFA